MKKFMINVLGILMVGSLFGATVSWDSFIQYDYDGNITVIDRQGYNYSFDQQRAVAATGIMSSVGGGAITVTGVDIPLPLSYSCLWVEMLPGELINRETMTGRSDYFMAASQCPDKDGKVQKSAMLSDDGGVIYLAVLQNTYWEINSLDYFGWVELNVDQNGEVSLGRNAFSLDGSALIVGGGAVGGDGAIPEPTSAVLVLVGVGLLGLRRRKRTT